MAGGAGDFEHLLFFCRPVLFDCFVNVSSDLGLDVEEAGDGG